MIKETKSIKAVKEDIEVEKKSEAKQDNKSGVNIHVSDNSNLKELIEKNIKWSQVIYEQNKKIKHRLTMMVIGSYLRLALIIIPIVLAILYLPPIVKNMVSQYQSILGGGGSSTQIGDLLGDVSSSQLRQILDLLGSTK